MVTREPNSHASTMLKGVHCTAKFEGLRFYSFLYSYLVSIRKTMWSNTEAESDNMYVVS